MTEIVIQGGRIAFVCVLKAMEGEIPELCFDAVVRNLLGAVSGATVLCIPATTCYSDCPPVAGVSVFHEV